MISWAPTIPRDFAKSQRPANLSWRQGLEFATGFSMQISENPLQVGESWRIR
jgi:hypothetical protein